jgi:hypothetical protein
VFSSLSEDNLGGSVKSAENRMNGARALQMDNILGSFEKGKKPGVVLIGNVTDRQLTQNSVARKIL